MCKHNQKDLSETGDLKIYQSRKGAARDAEGRLRSHFRPAEWRLPIAVLDPTKSGTRRTRRRELRNNAVSRGVARRIKSGA